MKKLTALKNKNIILSIALLTILLGTFIFYFTVVKVTPNDRILTDSNGNALFSNENPTFSVNFGDKNNPDSQYIKFETEASSKNPFDGKNSENIFTKIAAIFLPKKKSSIEISLKQIGFSETPESTRSEYDTEVTKVADILGTSQVKTSTTVADSGHDITASGDDQKNSKPTVINASVANGIDLEYQIIQGKGLKEEIIIQSLDGFSDECKSDLTKCKLPLNEYTFDLRMDAGASVKEGWYSVDGKSTKMYYFVDNNGKYLAHFLPSYAEDNSGSKTSNVSLKIEDKGNGEYEIKVIVDSNWLLDSNRVYPVRIDPSIVHDTSSDFSTGTFMSAKYLIGSELQITDPSVLGDWSFDETTLGTCTGGGDICDRSGNGYHATIAGTATSVIGIDSYARDFNGATGTHASFGDIAAFEVQSFTIEGWVRKEGTCGAFNYCTIFSKGGSGLKGYTFGLYGSSPVLDIRLDDQGSNGLQVIHGTTVLSNNIWYYVAVAVDGVNKSMKLYLNGNLEASGQYSDTISYGTEIVKIGNGNNNDDLPFYGSLDDIKFSNRAKSQTEVQNAYNKYSFGVYRSPVMTIGGVPSVTLSYLTSGVKTADGETPYSTTGLVAQWNFNETSGTTAASGGTCGTSCNGTLTNMTTTGQDAATMTGWTANNRRWGAGAVMFDGTNDYAACTDANCGGSGKLDSMSGSISIETWVNPSACSTATVSPGIVDKYDNTNAKGYLLYNEYYSGANVWTLFDPVNNSYARSTSKCTPGRWTHIVAIYDSAAATKSIYVNGKLEVTLTSQSTFGDSTSEFDIGRYRAGGYYFNGLIDSTRIYSRALTATEILSNYNSGVIEFQIRSGNTTTFDDGTWSDWTTTTNETAINSFDNSSLYDTSTPGLTSYWAMDDTSTVKNVAVPFATGGNVTYSGGYTIHTFSSGGTLVVNGTGSVDVLVVGGGGGGGGSNGAGGGGGAGGVVYSTGVGVTGQSYSVTVGTGGAGSAPTAGSGTAGGASSLGSLVSASGGGGGGGYTSSTTAPTSGGSGGGGGSSASGTITGASGTSGQGNSGGDGILTSTTGSQSGGGGGGASTVGQAATTTKSGDGGDGLSVSITGSAVTYGGGGAGAKRTTGSAGTPGAGGGGTAGVGTAGGAGTNGLGGGGGGGGNGNSGGTGGSGIVIVRYLSSLQGTANSTYDGTLAGTTSTTSAKFGNARTFNGSSDYVSVASLGSYSKDSSITLAAWVNSSVSDTATHEILSLTGSSGSFVAKIVVNNYLFRAQAGKATVGGDNADDTVSVVAGNWYYVVGVFSGSQVKLYVNGVLKTTTNYANAASSSVNTNGWNIGKYVEVGTSYYYWKGTIDEPRVFNTALSAATIQADYIQGLSQVSVFQQKSGGIAMEGTNSNRITNSLNTGLVAYWNLNEASGTSLTDSVSGNTGVASGTTVVAGKYNLARGFTSSNITVPTSSAYETNTWTWSTWINPNWTSGSKGYSPLILGLRTANSSVRLSAHMVDNHTGIVYWNGTANVTHSYTFANSTWYELTITYNNGSMTTYVNGISIGNSSYSQAGSTSQPFTIGSRTDSAEFFTGSIDEVKIYNIVKSPDEVLEEYNATNTYYANYNLSSADLSAKTSVPVYVAADKPGSYISATLGESAFANYQTDANTVGLWHLDEISGSGAYLKDSSGKNINATPTSATSVAGKMGAGISLNNTAGSYIGLNLTSTIASNYTVSSWVYLTSNTPGSGGVPGLISQSSPCDVNKTTEIFLGQGGGANPANLSIGKCNAWSGGQSTGSYPLNQWAYIAVTVDSSKLVTFYINGQNAGTYNASAVDTTIKTDATVGGMRSVGGTIDELRIDNTARTAEQIRQAYEVGLRTHNITIQFGANLNSGNLIANSSDTSFTVDATQQGLAAMGSNLYTGDKIIVREVVSGTEYIAQGTASAVNTITGATTVLSWDTGSTFPSGGFSIKASVFKWERQYIPIAGRTISTQIDAISLLTLRITDGYGGRNVWIDDLRSNGGYINTSGDAVTLSASSQYVQYRALFLTVDGNVSPYLNQVQVDYVQPGPTMDQIMRHGMWFDSGGVKRTFWWIGTH